MTRQSLMKQAEMTVTHFMKALIAYLLDNLTHMQCSFQKHVTGGLHANFYLTAICPVAFNSLWRGGEGGGVNSPSINS